MSTGVENPGLAAVTGVFGVGWPLLVAQYEVPLLVGALVYLVVGAVLLWFVIRPMLFPPEPGGI